MRTIPCYMCEEKTRGSIAIEVSTAAPEKKILLASNIPLCEGCLTKLKLGSLYFEMHHVIEAEKSYRH